MDDASCPPREANISLRLGQAVLNLRDQGLSSREIHWTKRLGIQNYENIGYLG
jgi:hypothetical protein